MVPAPINQKFGETRLGGKDLRSLILIEATKLVAKLDEKERNSLPMLRQVDFIDVVLHEELDNDMRKCKEEFKEFERHDVNYQKDFKHISQKIKKLEDKLEKDSSKIEALMKKGEESTDLIPKLEDNILKLQKLLLDEEKILDEITKSSKVENLMVNIAFTIVLVIQDH
ncbi:structural maintenance of chromosome 4 [Vigna unguiculata]|uniref:Structural maintenance of chromosome 4 n=1 Tax=Vigna unguiculata TaxID=3917 RepID=A0A4D6KGY1_VIGUN|nr:structural maintenance of chromosome 4 [Vigna unguiculata]